MKKRIAIEFITIFTLSLIFSLVFNELTMDDIWHYGFSKSMADGLIPYRDFNMIVLPLSAFLNTIFLKIFGEVIINMYILNAIYSTGIYFLLKKNNPNSYYLPYILLLIILCPNYNILILLLCLLLIEQEKDNHSDYLIGINLGLIFLTKQSTGIFLLLPTIITGNLSKKMKRLIGFIIPVCILFIYLVYHHALYDFIDYCFLGLIDFGRKNHYTIITILIPIIISIVYLIIMYLKTKKTTILYLITLFSISYPLMDIFHFFIPFIPTFNYFLNNLSLNKKIVATTFTITISILSIYNINKVFYSGNYRYPNDSNSFKYNLIDNKTVTEMHNLTAYYKQLDGQSFFINPSGYIMKLETSTIIGKYDLMLNGNNGKEQPIKEISTICAKSKCYFWINKYSYESANYNQYNKELHKYVIDNYQEITTKYGLTIYTN